MAKLYSIKMNFIMKKILHLGLILILALSLNSCQKWLDINVNPDSPTNTVATVSSRLPWIQHHYTYGFAAASIRAAEITGAVTSTVFTGTNGILPAWNPTNTVSTTPYQHWFVGAACNLGDLMTKAEAEQAWHYMGAALTLRAMGFMMMLDWYGEMPYEEALSSVMTPAYADGKTIFEGCIADLDEALVYFQKTQPATATALSAGDEWNQGNVQKWIKMIYGLKARWLNNLSKKAIYNPTAILAAIALAPQTNADGAVIQHVNDPLDMTGDVLVGDPLKTALIFNSAAWSDWARFTKWYVDLLENTYTGGSGVVDPRADKMLPSAQHWIGGQSVMIRTKGVDAITSDIRLKKGPVLSTYTVTTKKWGNTSTDAARKGDTVYVGIKALCGMTGATTSESTLLATDGTILTTGTFYTRPESPTDVLTYHEMCFIKAEVLLRTGDKAGALIAYKAGIRAHMELMNTKLAQYGNSINPCKKPMTTAAIDAFLASAAVAQTTTDLTMAKIMQQKYIAMSWHQQNWNDMRRFNYSAGNIGSFGVVYPGFDRPMEFNTDGATKIPGTSKTADNYWFRRIGQCSHEINYNSVQMKLSNPKAFDLDIWSVPVWWDTAE